MISKEGKLAYNIECFSPWKFYITQLKWKLLDPRDHLEHSEINGLTTGGAFGERGIISHEVRSATVRCNSKVLYLLSITDMEHEEILWNFDRIRIKN